MFLDPKPPIFKPGSKQLSAQALNQMLQADERQFRGGRGIHFGQYGDRTSVIWQYPTSQVPDIRNYLMQFVVLAESGDYLVCSPYRPPVENIHRVATEQEEEELEVGAVNVNGDWTVQEYDDALNLQDNLPIVLVAKPYQLQQTPWNLKRVVLNGTSILISYSGIGDRTAHDSIGNTERHIIVPDYVTGDVLLAVLTPTGYRVDVDVPKGFVLKTRTSNIIGVLSTIDTSHFEEGQSLTITWPGATVSPTVAINTVSATEVGITITSAGTGHILPLENTPIVMTYKIKSQVIYWQDINCAARAWTLRPSNRLDF